MALNWNYNERIGQLFTYDEQQHELFRMDIYRGNAMMILLYHYQEEGIDKTQMYCFFVDKAHAKNCLKDAPEMFKEWTALELWDFNKDDLWLASELVKKHKVEVRLLPEAPKLPF